MLDAQNLDGEDNATLSPNDVLATAKNLGSIAVDFSPVGSPTYNILGDIPVVLLDGSSALEATGLSAYGEELYIFVLGAPSVVGFSNAGRRLLEARLNNDASVTTTIASLFGMGDRVTAKARGGGYRTPAVTSVLRRCDMMTLHSPAGVPPQLVPFTVNETTAGGTFPDEVLQNGSHSGVLRIGATAADVPASFYNGWIVFAAIYPDDKTAEVEAYLAELYGSIPFVLPES